MSDEMWPSKIKSRNSKYILRSNLISFVVDGCNDYSPTFLIGDSNSILVRVKNLSWKLFKQNW